MRNESGSHVLFRCCRGDAGRCPLGGCKPAPTGQSASSGSTIGPLHLIDQDGKPADQKVLTGKWTALFFGYTYCPDACPPP